MMTIIMTNLPMEKKVAFKWLFGSLTKEQKQKLKDIKKAMDVILVEAEKTILREPKVLAMKEMQIIYGISHVLFEDQVIREIQETGQVPKELAPFMTQIQQQTNEIPSANNSTAANEAAKKTKVWH